MKKFLSNIFLTALVFTCLNIGQNAYCQGASPLTNHISRIETSLWGFDYTNEVKHMGVKYGGSADSNGAKSKFLGLFKSSLNVSKDDTSVAAVSGATGEDSIRPVFYTNDGAKWDLTGTVDAWEDGHEKPEDAGIGEILIDVNGDDGPNCRQGEGDCDDAGNDFDQYVIEVLASGKLRISASDRKASEFATINTSIRDSL